MAEQRAIADCLSGKGGGKRRKRACTVVRVIHEPAPSKYDLPRSWALVRFDGIKRIYVKALHNLELIRGPTRIRNGRPAA